MPAWLPNARLRRVIFVPACIASIVVGGFYWGWLPYKCLQNEKNVIQLLELVAKAEADFRANDRDANGVRDFWTGDLAGLYSLRPGGTRTELTLFLIPRGLAEADVAPIVPQVQIPIPLHGYYFAALEGDERESDPLDRLLRRDTGGTVPMGKVHNLYSFGFCAWPSEYGRTGRRTFLVSETNAVVGRDVHGQPIRTFPKE